jgi:hypothetical protein
MGGKEKYIMNAQNVQSTLPSPFWWRWLIVATIFVLITGIAMVVTPEPVSRMFSLILSSPKNEDIFGASARAYLMLFQGVLGATMIGWSMALLLVAMGPFRRGLREGWTIIAVSMAAWYIFDTSFSLWTGFWMNAVLNTGFLILFAIPLAATYRSFFQK